MHQHDPWGSGPTWTLLRDCHPGRGRPSQSTRFLAYSNHFSLITIGLEARPSSASWTWSTIPARLCQATVISRLFGRFCNTGAWTHISVSLDIWKYWKGFGGSPPRWLGFAQPPYSLPSPEAHSLHPWIALHEVTAFCYNTFLHQAK